MLRVFIHKINVRGWNNYENYDGSRNERYRGQYDGSLPICMLIWFNTSSGIHSIYDLLVGLRFIDPIVWHWIKSYL